MWSNNGMVPNPLLFGIFDKENSTHIGNIKFDQIDFEKKVTVMGILIGNSLWRSKGVGEEVLKTTAKFMNTLGMKTIYSVFHQIIPAIK